MEELIKQAEDFCNINITDCHGFDLDKKAISSIGISNNLRANINVLKMMEGDQKTIEKLTDLLRKVNEKRKELILKANEEF